MMVGRDEDTKPDALNSFQKFDEVDAYLKNLLSVSLIAEPSPEAKRNEQGWLNNLGQILDEYQEQPNLLDPYLERLVVPIAEKLRSHVADSTSSDSPRTFSATRVHRLAFIMYIFVKVRGYKTIVRFFPHDVSDLPMVINYYTLAGLVKDEGAWALRYIIMLWLSLVCMLPFDLKQFDEEGRSTANSLENIGMAELSKPGLEKDGAALLLSRLYMRKDTSTRLESFLEYFEKTLQESPNLFAAIGSLRVLADVAKTSPYELLQPHIPRIQSLINEVAGVESLSGNTVIRKLRAKCLSRLATRLLPARRKRIRGTAKYLDPSVNQSVESDATEEDEELDVPNGVEAVLGELFELLQDKDTFVRWSSAKGLANVSERLPSSFIEQIIDNILGHYSVYGSDVEVSELPATAEHSWHGATLACAELARRNLVSDRQLPDVLFWTRKALFFDVQKGSFSVGSNVRDSAAYVAWSLARTRNSHVIEKYATELAQDLVTVALFDREIHVRRAASAAFQENVGRTGLFPHGIAIIILIDFYSVGIRRHAFLNAATEVYRYKEYQPAILQHLLRTTLRHWDEAMRRLGAQSLRAVCETDLGNTLPGVLSSLAELLKSVDTKDIHGALLAIGELAGAIESSDARSSMQHYREKIFGLIDSVPSSVVLSPRNHLILEAACYVIANALSPKESDALCNSPVDPYWRSIIFHGLKSRNGNVQEASAAAIHTLSRLRDCSDDYLRQSSGIMQQSLARVLGSFDYLSHRNGFDAALPFLLEAVNPKSTDFLRDVEARRNAYTSIAAIINRIAVELNNYISPDVMSLVWKSFFVGLADYTVNERGDVGSWVRLACIEGVSSVVELLITSTQSEMRDRPAVWVESYTQFSQYLPPSVYHEAIGKILKQGVERLDNVRQCVGRMFLRLLELPHPPFDHGEEWSVRDREKFVKLLEDVESVGWNDGAWFYPRAVHFLDVKTYLDPVLRGLLLSIGSKTSSTQQLASSAMLAYARSLPPVIGRSTEPASNPEELVDLYTLVSDILAIAQENPKMNNTVIPVLHLFNVFLEGGVISNDVVEHENFIDLLAKMMELASRNVERLQSLQRIDESMRIVVNMLGVKSTDLNKQAMSRLEAFLLHPFPKVRNDSAEALYLALQTKDIGYEPEAEEILLETEWSTDDVAQLWVTVQNLLSYLLC